MDDISLKYNLLDKSGKKEIGDFIDFLLKKKQSRRNDLTTYKKNLLKISKWSDEDIAVMEENKRVLNDWKLKDW